MNVYLDWTRTILYHIAYPIRASFNWLLYILQPIWYLVYTILLPFAYVAHFLRAVALYPLQFLGTLETLYIFLSTAALVGLFTGTILYFSSAFLTNLLNLSPDSDSKSQLATRTVQDYRAQRIKKKSASPYPLVQDLSRSPDVERIVKVEPTTIPRGMGGSETDRRKRGSSPYVSSTTILEEDDSEEYF